ncbi:class I SAM-dependent methyltransferase [Erysipelothrix urinaevulpis]|uniref:class I SAM-dependent methyltransferase n=1 Tax=Erysipelothrix urinaevulpis TaxID=2683717 RepID=UPI00135C0A37|nr:methyltransferase domain-containing protein [Erysipelothrix urinaevulpis]
MKNNKLKFWLEEESASFLGWDFSRIDNRWHMEDLPWDYSKIVKKYLDKRDNLLDMGTGDGEYLLSLSHPLDKTYVTEGYPPNYQLCMKKLAPLGIKVHFCDNDILPFDDDFFNLIINRHESLSLSEVFRTLKPGGYFVTQQVGAMNNYQLAEFILDTPHVVDVVNTLAYNLDLAKKIGFTMIERDEAYASLKFFDIGALVYYAKIIQWEFPGFSVRKHFEKLNELDIKLKTNGFVDTIEHRYLIVLMKPL